MSDVYGFRSNKSRAKVVSYDDDVQVFKYESELSIDPGIIHREYYEDTALAQLLNTGFYVPYIYLSNTVNSQKRTYYMPSCDITVDLSASGFNIILTLINSSELTISAHQVVIILTKVE